ncbi:beta-ketoacyl synthase N-terminal-like domain-containing protein, partial [Streptomyces sp. NPDC017248]|uniref:beta-ketoacyl synthase N-terminal-like domain-containing protein n=1 Tax=unclassified Streptomyces TaxID=2593676 RepID=UPI0037A5B095
MTGAADMGDADLTARGGVAIIGMAGRFPGARDLTEFWENLRDGVESIVPL